LLGNTARGRIVPAKSPQPESRRHPRIKVKWPVVVELDGRVLQGETVDVSQLGVKVRLGERLPNGLRVKLHLDPAEGCPVDAHAVVFRTDDDGTIFVFIKKNLAAPPPGYDNDPPAARVLTILVVDDDPSVGALVRDILRADEYAVLFTDDPFKAVGLARQHPADIDLLLVDVVMPLMDGRELARRVLELRPKTKVLLMSGFEMSSLRDAAWPIIEKPFGVTELAEKIEECTTARKRASVFSAPARSPRPPSR
jgi:CheY-like chemotaxis protein